MADLRLTLETRRAAFRAQVVAIACGEGEVSTRRMAAAVLATDEVRSVCARAGVSAEALMAAADGAFGDVLTAVETSLAARGEQFGGRSHIDSLHPLPLSDDMKRAFGCLIAARAATPADLLLAVLLSDEGLAGELAARGLTADVLCR